jgi:tubulin polyglutamylase complex subunit 2
MYSKEMAAFDIDCKVKAGRLAILYRNGTTKPQVWFQDNSCKWFFVANTFTDYFRLMIMHLGLPHWQYAFTQVGLDAQTLQWFRFLSPERLAIDIENRRQQEAIARK